MTIIIAGERSGVGKTTITLAILAYLCDRGKAEGKAEGRRQKAEKVQSFKVGPDYIDPMFHTYVTGRPCRNLDPVLTSEDYVRQCFNRHCQDTDYAIIEGVMGLFDGASGTDDTASTAHIARLLDIPIVLVLDCSRLSRSVAAIIHGYTTFDPRLKFAGVILNRVGSDRHLHLLNAAIAPLNIPILGVLHRETPITIPDRHLGLIPTDELPALDTVIQDLRAIATNSLNWDLLLPLLEPPPPLSHPDPMLRSQGFKQTPLGSLNHDQEPWDLTPQYPNQRPKSKIQNPKSTNAPTPQSKIQNPKSKIRLAVARDRAFNFYYADNFDILEHLGATLVFWSPLTDPDLPNDVHGLYLGGGFPEVFASKLADNKKAKASVKAAIAAGLPTYAECGGLMYLCESIVDFDGGEYPMVGIIPATVQMGQRLALGYRRAIAHASTPLVESGQTLWGHEFHHSCLTTPNPSPLYERYGYGPSIDHLNHHHSWEGWHDVNLHASYLHVHWGAQPHSPKRFLSHCQRTCLK